MYPDNRRRPRGRFLFAIPVAVAIAFGISGAVMLLWNNVLAQVVPVKQVNYWQALGLLVLARLLFGNFRGGGGRFGKGRDFGNRGAQWREKLQQMTPEDRDKFREEWRRRRGGGRC